LGLAGPVTGGELAAVLSGHHPVTGRPVTRRPPPTAGYDLTFSAPKSVSVLYALGDRVTAGRVLAAHEDAVVAAMGYVERRAVSVRRGAGDDRRVLPGEGVVGAVFTHRTSRAGDPHLHSHVVLANLVHGSDGRWTVVDGRGLHAHAAAAGALHGAHLRQAMVTSLGVSWRPVLDGSARYEVDGIDPLLLGAFSGRRAEIREHLARRSLRSRRADRVAWAATREAKIGPDDGTTVLAAWRVRADSLGWDAGDLALVLQHRPGRAPGIDEHRPGRAPGIDEHGPGPAPGIDEHRFAAALFTSPHASATRRAVVAAWSDALREGAAAGEVERSVNEWVVSREAEVGVSEPTHALAALLPPSHLLQALGPRPATAAGQRVWRDAARSVERYRARWGVADPRHALGEETVTAMAAAQLADRLAVGRELAGARRRLGRGRDLERVGDPHALGRER
jgi:conjugative relaxase-like TrwC/TraI family protein